MEPRISIITLGVTNLERSIAFYRDGLGFPTKVEKDAPIAFFETSGTRLALYPLEKFAEEFGDPALVPGPGKTGGFTLAHNTKKKEEVDAILEKAAACGGRLIKPAQDVFWGGYSGYFSDPDGHMWEVAYADSWQFNPDGSLIL